MVMSSGTEDSPDASIDDVMRAYALQVGQPLVKRADGSGPLLPLGLYWPGFDLSAFRIIDPSTGEAVSGAGYVAAERSMNTMQVDDVQPEEDDSGGDPQPDPGFYRVVRYGVHLSGVTNGIVLSGAVQMPIELGATNESVPQIQLYADGIAAPMSTVRIPSSGFPVAQWDTTFLTNGNYLLHAECGFVGSAEVLVGVTNSITIANPISFDTFSTMFGGQMWVHAGLAFPEAEFWIEIFADGDYIGWFDGVTTNGYISFVWDLTDPYGQPLDNASFEGDFYVAPLGAGPMGPAGLIGPVRRKWYKDLGFSGDRFVVAWALTKANPFAPRTSTLVQSGVVDILASPAADDPYELSPGNTFNGTTFRLVAGTKTNLLSYLADQNCRNFYFFGHGNSGSFGDYTESQSWLVNITETEVRGALGNYFPTGTNAHPYRFVFLDSCKSANGPLPEAFGIAKHQLHRVDYYQRLQVMSRAFVGYTETDITLPRTSEEHISNASMLGNFMHDWLEGANLDGIVGRAKLDQYWPLDPSATIWGATNLYRYCP
jgi:hypothetical protein